MNQETNFANSWSPNQSWNLNTGLSFDLQSSSADSTKGTLHLTISNLSPPYDQLCKVHTVLARNQTKKWKMHNLVLVSLYLTAESPVLMPCSSNEVCLDIIFMLKQHSDPLKSNSLS